MAIDIISNEFPEIYKGSYKRFPSHEIHERVILVKGKRPKKYLFELETYKIESSSDVYQFIEDHIR